MLTAGMPGETPDQVYRRGQIARAAGDPRSSNPYPLRQIVSRIIWYAGWIHDDRERRLGDRAYHEGRQARLCGVRRTANPHPGEETLPHLRWDEGWHVEDMLLRGGKPIEVAPLHLGQ